MGSTEYAGKSAYRGEVASSYDRHRVVEPLWDIEQAWVGRWAETLPAGAVVLDLPAGTGRFVDLLLAREATVWAFDISEDMLAEIRRKPAAANRNLVVSRADAERLGIPDASVDCVLCWRLLHLLPLTVVERVLGEFRRVCRGRIVVEVLPVRTGGWAACMPGAVKRCLRPVRRWWSARKSTAWSHIASHVHAERDLLAIFARLGLQVSATETIALYDGLPVRVYTLVAGAKS